ncbi:MAG TPA: 3-hydroxyacyl-CoA dehydrogenase NAD-binding domain-containing protein, partial [Puia sp.]|nr:3-hydroxyacyl-CoA dehydrogenase NAD-binding domain-containing protein [Puia sp.]
MKKVAVIGAGTMGNGIAHVFSQFGFEVNLIDLQVQQLEKAMATIERNLDRQVQKGIIDRERKQQTISRINAFTD